MFRKFQITEIIDRTTNVRSYRFDRPPDFLYLPGQYVMVQVENNGNMIQKTFSLSSSPTEEGYLEITKKFTGHEFSDALKAREVGDELGLDGPRGSFILNEQEKNIVMLAGGIGVTPFRSMIKYSMDRDLDNTIVLICSNRTEEDIIFSDEFRSMMRSGRLSMVLTCTRPSDQWKGICGRIDRTMIQKEVTDLLQSLFYICGPPSMVQSMREPLEEMEVPKERILFEDFYGY
ncbi:MAG: FAD-dependent oxidoreductase [Methanosarcinales archaeon]|nr:FAD-dependent oxidoreductase [ANME-2 cluster archaeon]MDF1531365.1 FAD-dependent oxidoreductase [ANME-2 cluster archaeon]MDW7774905.1 FAD-dependent oxidoreductase [Methanosarcinales archaeon]